MQTQNLSYTDQVEQYGLQEISLPVEIPESANPFVDLSCTMIIDHDNHLEHKEIAGFYDGEGLMRFRFMPSFPGTYSFYIRDNNEINAKKEPEEEEKHSFLVLKAKGNNHGPVRIANTFHFAYEDGTPFYPIGTTCYVWNLQKDEEIESTLKHLASSGFNKIRFCLFPKHYDYNLNEPRSYPFAGTPMNSALLTSENFMEFIPQGPGNDWDFERFNVEHFQHIDKLMERLQQLEIQADIILFHPYDRWGFSTMSLQQDLFYLDYVIARYGAYRNVWWALANEYDLFDKSIEHWEKLAEYLVENDPYGHLRSIHNCRPFYDHTRPWITHASLQRQDLYRNTEYSDELRIRYQKPIVWDEIGYEGNLQHGWGALSAKELTRRSWEAITRGAYPQHGETILGLDEDSNNGIGNDADLSQSRLWWAHGGELKGESWKRLKFLQEILKGVPGLGLMPYPKRSWDESAAMSESSAYKSAPDYLLFYYGFQNFSFRDLFIDENTPYRIRVIDTWNMEIEDLGLHTGKFRVDLPGREFMAIELKKADNETVPNEFQI